MVWFVIYSPHITKNCFIIGAQTVGPLPGTTPRTPNDSPVKSSKHSNPRTDSSHPSAVVVTGVHPIPSPEALALKKPRVGLRIQGFYLVTVGKECGIFFTW